MTTPVGVRASRAIRPLALLLAMVVVAGCGSAADLPLPGRAVDGPSYELTAVFDDALNLPDGAQVRVAGDTIGRVQRIEARDFTAIVTMAVRTDVALPTGTTAELRQPTPLGDVFVELAPPAQPGTAVLRSGDVIGLPDTSTAASVEDLLAAASTLVNGGGLAQLQTIVREFNNAFDGRGDQTGHLLGQIRETLATLNARTPEIDRILAAAQRLSSTARQRSDSVDAAFDDLAPGIAVLAKRTDDLADALAGAGRVSATGDRVLRVAGPDLRTVFRELGTVLDGFAATDEALGPSLRSVVVLGKVFELRGTGEVFTFAGSVEVSALLETAEALRRPDDLAEGGQATFTRNLERLLSELADVQDGGPR